MRETITVEELKAVLTEWLRQELDCGECEVMGIVGRTDPSETDDCNWSDVLYVRGDAAAFCAKYLPGLIDRAKKQYDVAW